MAVDDYIARTIMIPIVVSDADETTFSYYWKMIALPKDKVLLVHVFSSKEASKGKWREKQKQLSTVVKPFQEQCEMRRMDCQVILHAGKAGEGIVDLIKKNKPDLLITGSRGLNALHRALEPSVSEYVARHATVPVLVVANNWKMPKNNLDVDGKEKNTVKFQL